MANVSSRQRSMEQKARIALAERHLKEMREAGMKDVQEARKHLTTHEPPH